MRFPISFDTLGAAVMTPLGCGRRRSHLEVDDDQVEVRLGWSFTATFPRTSITHVEARPGSVVSRGAHGWKGRWLVNGAGTGLVSITIDPPARARVTGVGVELRELVVSVEQPELLMTTLATAD